MFRKLDDNIAYGYVLIWRNLIFLITLITETYAGATPTCQLGAVHCSGNRSINMPLRGGIYNGCYK